MTANGANKRLVLHVPLWYGSLSISTPVLLLANEFDVRSVLHRQVSMAAVNQFYAIHEAMNVCKNLDSLKAGFITKFYYKRFRSHNMTVYIQIHGFIKVCSEETALYL